MLSLEQSKSLMVAANRYAQEITPEALEYLNARGISELVAAEYSLGVVTDPAPGHELHVGWLSIPYLTANGLCVGFKFRRLDGGQPKYGSPSGQKGHLYNVTDILKNSSRIVVCEGELDTIIVSGILKLPAVGVPGATAWKDHYARLLNGYNTVYILGDNDEGRKEGENPGLEFSRRVAGEVENSIIVSLPPGTDINEYYLREGIDAARRILGVTSSD